MNTYFSKKELTLDNIDKRDNITEKDKLIFIDFIKSLNIYFL
jgi:hypothetical protein